MGELAVRAVKAAAMVLAVVASHHAVAQDLGDYGQVYGIQEKDAIDQITGKLTELDKRGELKKLWEKHRDKNLAAIENPAPLPGISTVATAKVWTFDPSFTFSEDIKDHLGNLLVRAGTKVNPLQYTPLTKSLIFIDGRDPAQVAYAKKRTDEHPRDKVILVAGSFLKLNREWKRPTYFDQRGHLTSRLGIKRVPAIVTQSGTLLRVEEFVPGSTGQRK